jgi:transposase
MNAYVGLDISLKRTSICVVDEDGDVRLEGTVASDPDAIANFVRARAPATRRVGMESGPTSVWLWRELTESGAAGDLYRRPPRESRVVDADQQE